MDNIDFLKIIYLLFGLYAGVMSWLFKTAWNDIQKLKAEITKLKEDMNKSLSDLVLNFLDDLDKKLDSWWNKVECNLMNDGRLPPKNRKKTDKDA